MDYDQDYSRLTTTDDRWYEEIVRDESPETGENVSNTALKEDVCRVKKTCVVLDNEDFD